MPYTDKPQALLRAKERAADAGTEADAFLNEFLDLSSAKDASQVTHYRVFLTAAVWLQQSPQFQQLSESDGTKFTQMKDAIASLRALQSAYDSAQGLTIPLGFEAVTPKSRPQYFGSSSLKVVATP